MSSWLPQTRPLLRTIPCHGRNRHLEPIDVVVHRDEGVVRNLHAQLPSKFVAETVV